MDASARRPLRIAIAQMPLTADAAQNGTLIRKHMREAAEAGARLVLFPEGALSGYAKTQIANWGDVDWRAVHSQLESIAALAKRLHLWVVVGSAHPLTPPHWPHNSLYIISDAGEIVNRYDKRLCSHTETTRFYSPGTAPVVFSVDGFRFGCLICIEINFPQLFMEYEGLGVDCLLLPAYPEAEIFFTKARAHAAIHNFWVALSVPSQRANMMPSALIDPDGAIVQQVTGKAGLAIADINPQAPHLDIPLRKARPWRATAASGQFYRNYLVDDPRSANRTCL